MWYVYALYSRSSGKTYVGFTGDVERRLAEHNSSAKGFTVRYRPWQLLRKEAFLTKNEAMTRKKFLKTGRGREELKKYVDEYLWNTSPENP